MKKLSLKTIKTALRRVFVVTEFAKIKTNICTFSGILEEDKGNGYHYDTKAIEGEAVVTILYDVLEIENVNDSKSVFLNLDCYNDCFDVNLWTYNSEGFYEISDNFQWKHYKTQGEFFVDLTKTIIKALQ